MNINDLEYCFDSIALNNVRLDDIYGASIAANTLFFELFGRSFFLGLVRNDGLEKVPSGTIPALQISLENSAGIQVAVITDDGLRKSLGIIWQSSDGKSVRSFSSSSVSVVF